MTAQYKSARSDARAIRVVVRLATKRLWATPCNDATSTLVEVPVAPSPDDDELDRALRRPSASWAEAPATAEAAPVDDGVLLAYLDGRLDEAARDAVEARLADDPEARALLRALSAARATPDLAAARRAQSALEAQAPKRRVAVWGAVAVAAAAAVVVGVALWQRPPDPPGVWRVEGPFGGVQAARSADAGAGGVFLPHSRLRVDLVPAVPPTSDVQVAAYVAAPGDPLRRLPSPAVEVHASGALRVTGRADALLGMPPGPRTLWVVVGPAAADLEGAASPDAARRAGAAVYEIPIDYRARPDGGE